MPASEGKKRSNSKHDKENWQYITFKARTGSKDRIVEAAEATGLTTNGFIREAVSKAVMEAINKSLEPSHDEMARTMYMRILDEELNKEDFFGTESLLIFTINPEVKNEIREQLAVSAEFEPPICKDIFRVLSAELPPKTKGKAIRDIEKESLERIRKQIREIINERFLENPPPNKGGFSNALREHIKNKPELD